MILKTADGQIFHAHFWHHQRTKPNGRPHKRPRFVTELFFHAGPCEPNAETKRCQAKGYHASTKCHTVLDVFHKENGRATVLDRLLKMTTEDEPGRVHELFPRALRTQIWDSYKAQAKLPESRSAANGSRR